jgi:hypothetical protein
MAHPDPSLLRAFLSDAAERIEHHRPAIHWASWKAHLGPIALGAIVAACGGNADTNAVITGEGECNDGDCTEECTDGLDNDGDGTVDCDDPDCANVNACLTETGGMGTVYGISYTGGTDPVPVGGTGGGASGGTGAVALGGTGGDETGGTGGMAGGTGGETTGGTGGMAGGTGGETTGGTGGMAGGAGGETTGGTGGVAGSTGGEPALGGQPVYGVPYEYDCDNGIDDDYDGATDCDDSDCSAACMQPDYGIPYEYDCDNGVDDDYDELVDCDDPDCNCLGTGGAGGAGGSGATGGAGERYGIPF